MKYVSSHSGHLPSVSGRSLHNTTIQAVFLKRIAFPCNGVSFKTSTTSTTTLFLILSSLSYDRTFVRFLREEIFSTPASQYLSMQKSYTTSGLPRVIQLPFVVKDILPFYRSIYSQSFIFSEIHNFLYVGHIAFSTIPTFHIAQCSIQLKTKFSCLILTIPGNYAIK